FGWITPVDVLVVAPVLVGCGVGVAVVVSWVALGRYVRV
ncbi:ABC transporter permease, partial [Dermatophilus congolensis]|nr:ABC transporter permease [Dermatophilus congolensis]